MRLAIAFGIHGRPHEDPRHDDVIRPVVRGKRRVRRIGRVAPVDGRFPDYDKCEVDRLAPEGMTGRIQELEPVTCVGILRQYPDCVVVPVFLRRLPSEVRAGVLRLRLHVEPVDDRLTGRTFLDERLHRRHEEVVLPAREVRDRDVRRRRCEPTLPHALVPDLGLELALVEAADPERLTRHAVARRTLIRRNVRMDAEREDDRRGIAEREVVLTPRSPDVDSRERAGLRAFEVVCQKVGRGGIHVHAGRRAPGRQIRILNPLVRLRLLPIGRRLQRHGQNRRHEWQCPLHDPSPLAWKGCAVRRRSARGSPIRSPRTASKRRNAGGGLRQSTSMHDRPRPF